MSEYCSAESFFGWEQSYLSLPAWAERIRETHSSQNRMRDELDYFMCFFIQCYSLRDWIIQQGILDKTELDMAINSHDEMRICRDICNRHKHLVLDRKPAIDAHWEIARNFDHYRDDWDWVILFDGGRCFTLWDLMMKCLGFWEALIAAYALEPKNKAFFREFKV